jgi:hypothetical protein
MAERVNRVGGEKPAAREQREQMERIPAGTATCYRRRWPMVRDQVIAWHFEAPQRGARDAA